MPIELKYMMYPGRSWQKITMINTLFAVSQKLKRYFGYGEAKISQGFRGEIAVDPQIGRAKEGSAVAAPRLSPSVVEPLRRGSARQLPAFAFSRIAFRPAS